MKLGQRISGLRVELECDARFATPARHLLNLLAELDKKGTPLKEGTAISCGWTILTLREQGAALRLCEPDYLGDALQNFSLTLDDSLQVANDQVEMAEAEGVEALEARFDSWITIWPGAMEAGAIFLHRFETRVSDDSGWVIGDLSRLETGETEGQLEKIRVFELFRLRRSAMKLLSLPPGYAAVMEGEEISSIISGESSLEGHSE